MIACCHHNCKQRGWWKNKAAGAEEVLWQKAQNVCRSLRFIVWRASAYPALCPSTFVSPPCLAFNTQLCLIDWPLLAVLVFGSFFQTWAQAASYKKCCFLLFNHLRLQSRPAYSAAASIRRNRLNVIFRTCDSPLQKRRYWLFCQNYSSGLGTMQDTQLLMSRLLPHKSRRSINKQMTIFDSTYHPSKHQQGSPGS